MPPAIPTSARALTTLAACVIADTLAHVLSPHQSVTGHCGQSGGCAPRCGQTPLSTRQTSMTRRTPGAAAATSRHDCRVHHRRGHVSRECARRVGGLDDPNDLDDLGVRSDPGDADDPGAPGDAGGPTNSGGRGRPEGPRGTRTTPGTPRTRTTPGTPGTRTTPAIRTTQGLWETSGPSDPEDPNRLHRKGRLRTMGQPDRRYPPPGHPAP